MIYFYNSIIIVNIFILIFHLLKFIKNFFILKNNFSGNYQDTFKFLKCPDLIYNESLDKIDELQDTLVDLIEDIHQSEKLILDINTVHKEIINEFTNLDNLGLLTKDIESRYGKLNNTFNELFDSSKENMETSYKLMEDVSKYLKRG